MIFANHYCNSKPMDKEKKTALESTKKINDGYKNTIDKIATINNKVSILSDQTNSISKGILGLPLSNALVDINSQFSKLNTIYGSLPDINSIIGKSSSLEAARIANISLSHLLGNNSILEMSKVFQSNLHINQNLTGLTNPISSFLKQESSIAKLSSFPAIDKSITSLFATSSNIGKIAEYSLQAERNFSTLTIKNIGSRLKIEESTIPSLWDTLTDCSKSFSNLWTSYESNPKSFVELPPILLRIAPIEYFNTSSLIEKISVEENEDSEETLLTNDLLIENEETLVMLLPKLNPHLLKMWKGANQALVSDNNDKVRHFVTSIRELFTHVLHLIAPDDAIASWPDRKEEYYANGKVTRRGRLQYLYRNVRNEHFNEFIEADIKTTLFLINLFQEGTHAINSKLTDSQLISIKVKVESTLKYLLQTYYEVK